MNKMHIKMFEVRDVATMIPIMAIKVNGSTDQDKYLAGRANLLDGDIIVIDIHKEFATSISDNHERYRTLKVAHNHLDRYFDSLENGSVIDIEFILGEKDVEKRPELEQIKQDQEKYWLEKGIDRCHDCDTHLDRTKGEATHLKLGDQVLIVCNKCYENNEMEYQEYL